MITSNGRRIRSLPERVADNTKRISELEEQRELYQYDCLFDELDDSKIRFSFISNKNYNVEEVDDDFDKAMLILEERREFP